jgi:hypothetical protein
MFYFHTKNPFVGILWRDWEWKMLVYVYVPTYNDHFEYLRPFGMFYSRLVYAVCVHLVFFQFWYVWTKKLWQPSSSLL